ncbi:MAG: class I SAM-dependent methyltransferase [Granulosicoccus sp.]|nr:class I SAM-dependent methyltransferase [Granulosicoccus sp.]
MTCWSAPDIVAYRDTGNNTGGISPACSELLDSLDLPLCSRIPQAAWVLTAHGEELALTRPDGVKLTIDFNAGKARHRAAESGKGIRTLARALGLNAYRRQFGELPAVIDATGGLGQDAWALASLGGRVTVIEQHPIVHALLANALHRAAGHGEAGDIARRIVLLHGLAEKLLPELDGHAIYLDPMYPERKRKKADSRKGMQFLHALLGPSGSCDDGQLLPAALQCAVSRVVVKRPRGAEPLPGAEQWRGQRTCLESPNTRYDVYHRR